MLIPQDFIPDFTCKSITGMICNRYSLIQHRNDKCFISLNNKVHLWDLHSTELINTFGNRKSRITALLINDNDLFIGYEDGSIEIIRNLDNFNSKILKVHSKKITKLVFSKNRIIISGIDGGLCCYDTVLDEILHYFKGNSSSVEDLICFNDSKICAISGDKSIKIWNMENEILEDAIAFENYVFNVAIKGDEALVFLKTGESFFINLIDKSKKPFEKFKNLRNIQFKNDILCVQTQRKTAVFQSTKENVLGLNLLKKFENNVDFVNFDLVGQNPCFISTLNKIVLENKIYSFGFHENDIFDIKTEKSKIYSISKDKLIIWDRIVEEEQEFLYINSTIGLVNATCFTLFNNQIFIGTNFGIQIFDKKFYELKTELSIGKVSSITSSKNLLVVTVGKIFKVFDLDLKEINSVLLPETIVMSKFSTDFDFLLFSCLDNKIYQYLVPTFELKLVLYGHSLPVRQFSISTDQKLLATCGADKLVKLWGLEFGECRKTIVGDSQSVEFLNESLFLFSSKEVQYYNGFDKLKKFELYNSGVISTGNDYFVVSMGRGIALFSMNKYEYIQEEESNEIEDISIRNIANIKDYDIFLNYIEKLEANFTDSNINLFYSFLERLDFSELKEYLYVLDHISIRILLEFILKTVELNPLIISRVFIQLIKNHKETVVGFPKFKEIQNKLYERIKDSRDLYNMNLAQIDADMNDFTIDL